MPSARGRLETDRPGRCLEQFAKHAASMEPAATDPECTTARN